MFGKKMNLDNLDKVQGVIIRLRKNEDAETSKNVLIAMLEELIKRDSAEAKKKKLEEDITVIQPIYDLALEQKPDYNVDLILRAIQS